MPTAKKATARPKRRIVAPAEKRTQIRLTVERKSGEEVSYDPRRQQGVSVYREQERAFSVGDRVQLTAPYPDLKREIGVMPLSF